MRRIAVTIMAGLVTAGSQAAMQLSNLACRKADDPSGQRGQGPRAVVAVVAVVTGLGALAGAAPSAAAHAAAHKTVASVKPGSGTPAANVPSGCYGTDPIVDEHNNDTSHTSSYVPGPGQNLYFVSNNGTSFCHVWNGSSYQFYDLGPGRAGLCLALVDSPTKPKTIHEGSTTACANKASYTEWQPELVTNGWYLLKSNYNGTCMYDNISQNPATYATCSTSNKFEWISF